jgi:hypothetical protein
MTDPIRRLAEADEMSRPLTPLNSPFWPLAIAFSGLIVWLAADAWVSYAEYSEWASIRNAQAGRVDEAKKLAEALDKLIDETNKASAAGNPNAKALIDGLAQKGISIKAAPAGSQTR